MPSLQVGESNEISLYKDTLANQKEVSLEVKKLTSAFPSLESNYVIMLIDRLIANRFTKQRLQDAISHVIDTCPYPKPSVSEIVSFDRKAKTYTYNEMLVKCTPSYTSDNFEMIEMEGRKRWVEK